MPIYSSKAGRVDSLVIKDLITGKVYTDKEARKQPIEIRARLVNHYTKYGAYVMTIEEANKALLKQNKR